MHLQVLVGILALQGLELSLYHLGSHTEYLQTCRVSETKTTDMVCIHSKRQDELTQAKDKNRTK